MHKEKTIVIIGARPRSLVNFRGGLITTLISKGMKVNTMASDSEFSNHDIIKKIESLGANFTPYPIQRNSLNFMADLQTYVTLKKELNATQPDIILAYTIKPIIWTGLASRTLNKNNFFALITGLGFAFQGNTVKRKILSKLVTNLYWIALKKAKKVIFQNPDNLNEFIKRGIVPYYKCTLVNGSGVDLDDFKETPLPSGNPVFLAIGRLLGEKGFREYAQAAKLVKIQYPEVSFQLLGPEDPSLDGIPLTEIQSWHDEGFLEYLGSTADVRPYLKKCHVYVLPSYHEGMPRTVLEAMAIGRPILTTDVPGCRETVISGENGYLVSKANTQSLVERLIWFIENRDQWECMGKRSHQLAEEKYDVKKINAKMMEIMEIS